MPSFLRAIWDAMEFCCVAIPWQHFLSTPGEWELTRLVLQRRILLPSSDQPSESEWRAFAAIGSRPPQQRIAAESWRAVAEAVLDRWWRRAHGTALKSSVRFNLAREHALRGIPRIPRGDGAGEFLEKPRQSSEPLEKRGVATEWVRAFILWMHNLRLFKLPTRVFIEAFVTLLTSEHQGALYDYIPLAFRCEPQVFACYASDDALYSILVGTQQTQPAAAPWLSFIAANLHARRDASRVASCVAACEGVVVHLSGKGEPVEAIRPLLNSCCLLEICSAPPPETDPYAPPRPPPLRVAIGGVDDDVERHREIAAAIRALSSETVAEPVAEQSAGMHEENAAVEIKRLLCESGYAAVDTRVRELARRAFWDYYHRPQHVHIRQLYEADSDQSLW